MERSLHEIFTDVHEETSFAKKATILKENDTYGLRHLLRATYDDGVRWLVPNTRPPFEPNDAPDWDLAGVTLVKEMEKIGRFLEVKKDGEWVTTDQGRGMTKAQVEQLFITLLETLHPSESELVLQSVKGKLDYNGLTKSCVEKAFPGLLP
ncbi:MAG: hypothetical protein CL489_06800 [Acidobacteria bacterium]|nr:hypothetical protein [Acidobacteriota bacterium]